MLQGAERALAEADLEDLAQHCSFTERRADEAEREVVKWKQLEFMRAHVGEEFSGHVTGVVAFGVFVQLEEAFVEGLVHVADLKDDYYRYDETGHRLVGQRWGRVLRLGDAVRVRVKGINEEFMEVNLEPILPPGKPDEDGREARARRRDRAPRRPRLAAAARARDGARPGGLADRGRREHVAVEGAGGAAAHPHRLGEAPRARLEEVLDAGLERSGDEQVNLGVAARGRQLERPPESGQSRLGCGGGHRPALPRSPVRVCGDTLAVAHLGEVQAPLDQPVLVVHRARHAAHEAVETLEVGRSRRGA